jgi:predicted nucleic acid-binding Zn ribbon protein
MSTPTPPAGGGPGEPRRRRRRQWGPDRGPRPLRDGIDAAVNRLLPPGTPPAPPATAMAKILSRWEEIAGVALAGHVRPVGMTGSTLVVAADHPARATQVRMLSGELLSRIREMAGDAPDEIRVVVRPATSGRQPPEENGPVG